MSAILTDEIGIEFALLGKFRARARYRPVYRLDRGLLHPVAVQGEMATMHNGVDIEPQAMLGNDPSPAARQAMDLLAMTLIVRNHHRSDADALALYLDFPGGPSRAISLEALDELAAPTMDAGRITVFVEGGESLPDAISARLKERGYKVGLVAGFGDPALADNIALTAPHVVRIAGEWVEKAAENPALASLLARFVGSCRDAAAEVMFCGIDNPVRAAAAPGLGATLFSGDALSLSLPAGAAMNLSPVPLSTLTARAQNIVPFARRRRPG
ncbi:MAG: hypothetical protein M9924_12315 [Rhizobiaceae bacterium]|nr:hypothetical protein [Rhizobiaceae bacterium]